MVGLNGQVLNQNDIRVVREGARSTVRTISSETRNLANALRVARTVVLDRDFRRWANGTAVILEGISMQATLEADRLDVALAAVGGTP